MLGSPRHKILSLSPTRAPTRSKCRLSLALTAPSLMPPLSLARLTDENILLLPLDEDLFPGVPSSVLVHEGFALEQARCVTTFPFPSFRIQKQQRAALHQ